MIDYIKITLRNFTGTLNNCRFDAIRTDEETGLIYENYALPNHRQTPKQHCMKVARQDGSSTVTVKGSVRKWCNHRDTLADLNDKAFETTMKKLAEKLNIPFAELRQARFTQCEIGLNIKTGIPCRELIPMVVRYGGLQKNQKRGKSGESVYFEGAAKKLKIYDKVKEVANNAGGVRNRRMLESMSDVLRKHNYNLLRIEYTLLDHNSFSQHKLGHIKTIGDLINHYSDLYEFWSRETNRITIFNKVAASSKGKMSKSDLVIINNLERYGFAKAVELRQRRINKDKPSVSQMESTAQRKILTVIEKYYRAGYCTQTLRLDASRHLWRQRAKRKVDVPLSACLRALWSVKPGKYSSR